MNVLVKDRRFYSSVLAISIPIALQFLMLISVSSMDSVMLGSLSEIQMAAVSQAAQVFFIFSTLTYGFANGGSILISQYWGKRDIGSIRTVLGFSLKYNVLLGTLVVAVVMASPETVMRLYSRDAAVISEGSAYLRIAVWSYIPYAICNTLYLAYRGTEQAKIAAVSNIISCVCSITLNYALIFGRFGLPRMGVPGAAVGLLIARILELMIMLGYMLFIEKRIRFTLHDLFTKNAALHRDFLVSSRPVLGHEIVWSFGMSAAMAIMGQIGTSAVAAFNVNYVLFQLIISLQVGLSGAASVLIGKAVGSGNTDMEEIKKQSYTFMFISAVLGIVSAIIFIVGGQWFAGLFELSAEAAAYRSSMGLIMALVTFFAGWENVGLVGVLRGGGDAKTGFFIDVVVMWLIAIPLGLTAAFVLHLSPVWVILLLKLDMPLKGIAALKRVLGMRWVRDLTRAQG